MEVDMRLSEYLVFAAVLTPTLLVVVAAVLSLAAPDPAPEYRPPLQMTKGVAR
jgi:hypothetical protein